VCTGKWDVYAHTKLLIQGDNILLRDITLPENVDCYLDPRVPIVGVIKAK
jgi:hypothetical protein